MNRTDRLLAIVLELQAHRSRRAEDLAAAFEVSRRTIYRDVLALLEAGVPVISTPGRGYELAEGYFLPPLRFTPDEAVMLLLGSDVMAQSFDAEYRAAAEAAARKIAGALPDATRALAREIEAGLRFVEQADPREAELLRALRRAIVARRTVSFRYSARLSAAGPGATSAREADPYGLVRIGDVWYLVAHCHLRGGVRHFRLSRMEGARVLPRTFERPEGFLLAPDDGGRTLEVVVLFDRESAPWVREARYYYVERLDDHPEGLRATLMARRPDDVVAWVLGWGRHARVLSPPAVAELVAAEARAILAHHAAAT